MIVYHPVVIDASASIDPSCTIWQFATICAEAILESEVVIGSGVWIGKRVRIGCGSRIQHGTFIPNDTIIGAHVFIGPNVTMTDDRYPKVVNPSYHAEPPVLRDYCSIGAGAVLLPGVVIGERAFVGAGSVVTKSVTAFSTVIGVPAHRQFSTSERELYETA